MSKAKARAHFTVDFTPGKAKGIDYIFGGELRRLKKTVVFPSSISTAAAEQQQKRIRASVDSAPKDAQEQQWPKRGLKKVDNPPEDNKEAFLFSRRSLATVANPPQDKKEQLFPRGGKAMVMGRSHTTSGNILAWAQEPKHDVV